MTWIKSVVDSGTLEVRDSCPAEILLVASKTLLRHEEARLIEYRGRPCSSHCIEEACLSEVQDLSSYRPRSLV
jgi:hypothetical protein